MLPKGILAQVGEQCYDLEELDLKQCSGHEMLDVENFAALCDGCRQLKTMDLVVPQHLHLARADVLCRRRVCCSPREHRAPCVLRAVPPVRDPFPGGAKS